MCTVCAPVCICAYVLTKNKPHKHTQNTNCPLCPAPLTHMPLPPGWSSLVSQVALQCAAALP